MLEYCMEKYEGTRYKGTITHKRNTHSKVPPNTLLHTSRYTHTIGTIFRPLTHEAELAFGERPGDFMYDSYIIALGETTSTRIEARIRELRRRESGLVGEMANLLVQRWRDEDATLLDKRRKEKVSRKGAERSGDLGTVVEREVKG